MIRDDKNKKEKEKEKNNKKEKKKRNTFKSKGGQKHASGCHSHANKTPQSKILVLAASNLLLSELGPLDTRTSVALETTSRSTKVTESLTSSTAATKKNGVGASRLANCELIESETLTAGLKDACTSSVGEVQSADGHLGNVEQTSIIANSSNDDCSLLRVLMDITINTRERDDRAVGTALHQTLANLSVEGRVSATSKELVEPHKKSHVRICAVSVLAHMLLLIAHVQLIDCHLRLLTSIKTNKQTNKKMDKA